MDVDQVVEQLLDDPALRENIAEYRVLEPRDAVFADIPDYIDERLVKALRERGIDRLFSHQAAALRGIERRENVAVVTPTASGKTLCYNLPVLNAILEDESSRALYLFPTKALSQDQLAELHTLVHFLDVDVKSYTYDGDTPQTARRAVRSAGHVVVTNPDMLHSGILPYHPRWVRLFENLRFVVIDELHVYRGVFGSHVANVVRRLRRICRHYGSDPQFICCSATIANPGELAEGIVQSAVTVVDTNGSPAGKKHVILYNPPIINRQLGLRSSARFAARDLAARLLENNVQTIVFARSRTAVEVLLGYMRDLVGVRKRETVRGYRSGYLPLQRREIERGLRTGVVRAVVATNALELGIDIGALDACIVTGFPGTIASAWQQMGRAGRRNESSVAIMIGTSNPLDQFLMTHPDYFFGRSPEAGLIDPNNLIILLNQLKCAAFELPFQRDEPFGGDSTAEHLQYLEDNEILHQADGVWHWMSDTFPAQEISLRTATTDNVVIIDNGPPAKVIGEIDRTSAPTMVHDEAIYIHEGQQFQVEKLDLEEKKAFVKRVDVDYYTDAQLGVEVKVLEVLGTTGTRRYGEVAVSYLPTIFKKIKLGTHENVGWGQIHLDEDTFHTSAYWFSISEAALRQTSRSALETGLMGMAHVLGEVAPLFLMCDPRDIAVWPEIRPALVNEPTVYMYDRVPGGVGFSKRLYDVHHRLLLKAGDLVAGCGCSHGCPSCIGPLGDATLNAKLCVLNLIPLLLEERKPALPVAGAS